MHKKLLLILLVIAEIGVGSFFLFKYQQSKVEQRNILGASKIAKIDQSKIYKNEDEELKYYFEFLPNQVQVDSVPWVDHEIVYNINADGLNDISDYSIETPKDTFRIITLGDSFTSGHYVETRNNWTEILERYLNDNDLHCSYKKFEVINLGMPGYDIQYIVKKFEEVGLKYNPNLVLWFESGSGFSRFNEQLQPLIDICLGSDATLSATPQSVINDCWRNSQEDLLNNFSFDQRKESIAGYYDHFFKMYPEDKTKIIYYRDLPKDDLLMIDYWKSKYKNASFDQLIPFQTDGGEYKFIDGHPNINGHKQIANIMFEFLKYNEFCYK